MKRKRGSALNRRYGCFRLPAVPGAKKVIEVKRKDVSWLARTDPEAKTVEFSQYFDALTPAQKKYIVLHEQAHLETGPDHSPHEFYEVLKRLIRKHKISWRVAYELEQMNCHASH